MDSPIYVVKMSGEKEPFSEEKVLRSMLRVGVREDMRPVAIEYIKGHLYPDIKTTEIFSHIRDFLNTQDQTASIKFNLKQAIFELGPTGFPFEKYLARIFQSEGYTARVDVMMEGECVHHEVDVLIEKEGKKEAVEAKFHNQQGVKTDIHVLLYTYARFLDIKDKNGIEAMWVITNTKLSGDAIQYAKCKDIKAVAWNFPIEGNLQDLIEASKLYPVTILDFTANEKKLLLDNGYILCGDLLDEGPEAIAGKLDINRERLFKAVSVVESIHNKVSNPA